MLLAVVLASYRKRARVGAAGSGGLDEVTRALRKGQNALLEAMAKKSLTPAPAHRHVEVPVLGAGPGRHR